MNELISIMQDVAKLVTGGSDLARAEASRIDAERERRAEEMAHGPALHPTAILAVGDTEPPVERLMGLQSAFAKAVHFAVGVGQARPRLPRISLLRYRLR
jgi:hypothetical protein